MLTEDELVQKYNSYLPVDINCFSDLLNYVGIPRAQVKGEFLPEGYGQVEGFGIHVIRIGVAVHGTLLQAVQLA